MEELKEQSRRQFLKAVSFLAGSSALVGTIPWLSAIAAKKTTGTGSPSDRIRLGIIGVGSRGKLLLLHLQTIPDVEIAAVCDDYPPHFDQAKELTEGKARAFVNYRELLSLDDIDGVIIATPLHLHAQMTIDAMLSGKHVFCEKAMARTLEGCLRMVNAQKETGKILQIGHQRMFNIKYIKAIELIKSGILGPITQIRAYWHRNNDWRRDVPGPEFERKINWRLYREYSCGLMTELASHQIQVANWVLNQHPESVMGAGSINYWHDGREVYDNVNLIYNYPNGVKLIYDSLISNKKYGCEEQVMGDKGTMELEAGKMYMENPPPAPGIIQLINNIENKVFEVVPIGGASWVPDNAITSDKGTFIVDEYPLPSENLLELEGFVESIRSGKQFHGLLKEAFYASVGALLGTQAMDNMEVVYWPKEFII